MKRYIILALISCFAQWITAQTISVPDQSITSGRISTISIFLDNKEEITAFQLNAIFPKEISIQDISLSETRQSATHEIRWEKIEDRHFILAYSLKNESFKGESGCLLEIKVLNNSDAALGNYPITLKDIILTDKSGKETEQAEVYGMLMLIPLVVEAISLNKKEVSIEKGGTETLVATVMPEDATNKHLVWSSSDTQVAAVDNAGTVTALKGGTATVTVALDGNPELYATCLVTVIANAESVSLNKTELSIEKGKTESLIATVMPEDATNKHLVWSSSDTQVAAADNAGTITALKGGTATVTVALDGNPELHATCLVTVNDPTGIENNVLSEIKVIATVVEQEIILYGIPADDSIRINIYDMGGNTLYQQKVQDKTLIIPCSHYPKGIYLIQINEQGKNKIIKIVKK